MLEGTTLKKFNDAKNAKVAEAEEKKKAETQTQNEKDGFFEWLGKQAMSGVGSFNKSVMATLDFILPTEFLGRYDYISKMNDYYSNLGKGYAENAQKSSESRGKGWKTAGDVVSGTVAALPNAVLAFMSGGTSLGGSAASTLGSTAAKSSVFSSLGNAVRTMTKNPTYWTSAMQTLGTDYEEAKEKGVNDFVAATSAILTTALNAGIEVGGGIEKLPKKLKSGGKSAILDWVKSSFEEGGEEVLQGITSNAMAKLMYDHDAPLVSLTDENAVINPIESAKEFGMGVAVGGLLGAGQTTFAKGVERSNIVKAGKFFNKKGLADSVIYTGLESPKDSEAYKLAEKAMRKITEEDKPLTDYEVGKLYYASIKRLGVDFGDIKDIEDIADDTRFSIVYNNDGTPNTVVINEDIFKGHEGEKPHKVIENYLKDHIGDYATIIESGQKVYFGKDLPGEYTHSKQTRQLSPSAKNAKSQAAQELEEIVEIASDRQWKKNTKEKHNVDAKYGWYKYTSSFKINDDAYNADVLIRNDADGKKYLYDIINIKKTTARRGVNTPQWRNADESIPTVSETDNLFNNNNISNKSNIVNSSIRSKLKITTETLNKYIADSFAEAAHQDGASDDVKAYTSSAVQRMAENGVADLSTLRVFAEAYVNALHEKGSGGYLSIVSQTDNLPMALMEYTFGMGDTYVTDALKNNPAFLEASRGFKKSFIKSMEAGVRYSQNHQTAGVSSMSAQVEAIKQGDYSSLQQRNNKPSGNVSGNSIDGYIVNGMVNETELDMLAREAADGAYIRLEGSDTLDNIVLAYESGVSPEKVRNDITAYYRDGVMPEVEYPNDLPFEDDVMFSIAEDAITSEDVRNLQEMPKKSINDFTSEEIKATEKFARRYFRELGVKSPFFRAWFGDWRVNDKTPVHIVTEKGSNRGNVNNKDAGWDIQVSGKVFSESGHNAANNKAAIPYLEYINSIVENAILLDSFTIPKEKTKSENSAMMHSLYAVADIGNGKELIKLYVEELNDVNSDGTIKRAYQLQNIENQQLKSSEFKQSFSSISSTADAKTIADLFAIVKQNDKNFNPKPVSFVVNEDATPKVVYHGTSRGGFSEFDTYAYLSKYGLFGNGAYFTESLNIANSYTKKGKGDKSQVYSVYLAIKNPIDMDAEADISKWNKALRDMDIDIELQSGDTNEDVFRRVEEYLEYQEIPMSEGEEIVRDMFERMGYDGITHIGGGRVNANSERHRVWIAFEPTQIKSATDNIGTFDGEDTDIRFSIDNTGNQGYNKSIYPEWIAEVLENEDFAILESALLDIESGVNANYYNRSENGEYIIATGDKLIYTNGSYSEPEISKIVKFNSQYETEIDEMRRRIYDAEKGKSGIEVALQVNEDFIGQGSVDVYTASIFGENEESAGLGERAISDGIYKNSSRKQRRRKYVEEFRRASKKGLKSIQKTLDKKKASGLKFYLGENISENSKNDTNRSEINEGPGDLLLSEDNRRGNNESAGKQAYGIRQNGEGKSQSERLEFTRNLRERGLTSERTFNNKYVVDVISEDGYNEEMTEIAEGLKAYGFENVYFITGKGRFKFLPWRTFEGAVANGGKDVYIRYDAETTPAMLANHELAHIYYNDDVKKRVLAGVSPKELEQILQSDRYQEYNRIYNSYDKVLEEVVCDILSGMSEHSARFDAAINEFWSGLDADYLGEMLRKIKVSKVKMKTFPPYNESESDANEWSTRWAHREDVKSGDQKVISYHNRWYVIGKFDSSELKYLIVGRINKKVYETLINEVKRHGEAERRLVQDCVDRFVDIDEERNSTRREGYSAGDFTAQYGGENAGVQRLGNDEDGKREISGDTNGGDARNGSHRENSGLSEENLDFEDSDIRFTLSDNPDTSYLAEPVRELKDDIKEVMLRADAREGKVYTRADVRQVTNSILENIDPGTGRGLSMSRKLQSRMQNLVGWVLNTPAERREKYLKRLASYIAQNAVVYDASDVYDYEGDLDFLKGYVFHSIKLSDSDKETMDAIGASGYKSLFGASERGTGVDVVYDNMSQARPDLFPADSLSKLERIVEIYDFLKEGAKAENTLLIDVINQEDRQKFVASIENEINRAFDDAELGKNSKVTNALNRAEAEHLAEENRLRNMYETEKQELKNKYEKKIDALKKAAKEQGEKDVEEKGLKPKIKKYKAKATFGENDTGWGMQRSLSSEQKRDVLRELTVSAIINRISEIFDIPVSFGNMTDIEGHGEYKEKAVALRSRTANALPVICYELGIHLDKKYGLSEKIEDKGELTKFLDLQLLKSNKEQSRVSVAIAGFVRTYLNDKENAKAKAPRFYEIFVAELKKNGVLNDLDTVAEMVNAYMSSDFSSRVDAAIVSADDSKNVIQKAKEVIKDREYYIEKFGKTFIDSFLPQKNAMEYVKKQTGNSFSGSNNAYVMATNSREADSRANAIILNGMTDLNGNLTGEKSLLECLEPVRDLKLFDRYLLLKHAPSWLEVEYGSAKQVFADESLNDIASINMEVVKLENEHPEFKQAAANIYEYQRNLMKHFLVESGGMKQETFDLFMKMYPNYVPLFRVDAKNRTRFGKTVQSLANQVLPIKMAKGGSGEFKSPIESIMYNTKRFVQFGTRNQVAQMWGDYADTIDGMGKLIERVRVGDWGLPGDIEKNLEQDGGDVRNVQDMDNAIDKTFGKIATGYNPAVNKEKRIVSVLRNGEVAYYQVHDELLYESLADMAPSELTWAIKMSRTIMAPMKILTTSMNPIFSTTNAFRDIFTAYNNSDISNPVKFIEGYIKAVNMMLKQTPEWKQYKALGGGTMSDLSASRDLMKKTLRDIYLKDKGKAARLLSALKHPVHTVASINDFVESVPRFAEYLDVVTRTGDKALAFYKANDLTTNFRRTGTSGQKLNAIFMYNNAAIQGLDRVVRSFTDASKPERVKRALKYLIQALLFGVLVRWWNTENDKEGYENLSAYTKNNFYCFSIGDGKFITLPKAREMAILTTTVERTLDKLSGEDDAFYDFGGYLALQLIPPCLPDDLSGGLVGAGVNLARNTVAGSLVDIAVNEDFKGSPVVSSAYENLPKQMQYNEKTTYTAYFLGQILNQSPMEIDHVLSSTTGILGQMNKALLPMGGEAQRDWSIGVKNKYVRDSNYSTDVLNQVYEMRDSTENEVMLNSTAENALKHEKYKMAASYISEANKLVKSLPADEQRNARGKLLDVMNDWDYEMSAVDKYIIDSLGDAYVDDSFGQNSLPKSDISWTENKKKVVCQLSASQYEAYIKDVMKAINAGRAELIKTREYKKADADERIELIKEMDSDMKSAIKKKYQQKYGGKKK